MNRVVQGSEGHVQRAAARPVIASGKGPRFGPAQSMRAAAVAVQRPSGLRDPRRATRLGVQLDAAPHALARDALGVGVLNDARARAF